MSLSYIFLMASAIVAAVSLGLLAWVGSGHTGNRQLMRFVNTFLPPSVVFLYVSALLAFALAYMRL